MTNNISSLIKLKQDTNGKLYYEIGLHGHDLDTVMQEVNNLKNFNPLTTYNNIQGQIFHRYNNWQADSKEGDFKGEDSFKDYDYISDKANHNKIVITVQDSKKTTTAQDAKIGAGALPYLSLWGKMTPQNFVGLLAYLRNEILPSYFQSSNDRVPIVFSKDLWAYMAQGTGSELDREMDGKLLDLDARREVEEDLDTVSTQETEESLSADENDEFQDAGEGLQKNNKEFEKIFQENPLRQKTALNGGEEEEIFYEAQNDYKKLEKSNKALLTREDAIALIKVWVESDYKLDQKLTFYKKDKGQNIRLECTDQEDITKIKKLFETYTKEQLKYFVEDPKAEVSITFFDKLLSFLQKIFFQETIISKKKAEHKANVESHAQIKGDVEKNWQSLSEKTSESTSKLERKL